MVLFRWNVSSVRGDLTRLHSRRHNGCRTILVQKRRHHQHSLWNRSRQVLWQPTSIYKNGRLYDHRDFFRRQLVWPKKHIFDTSLEIHVSDIDSFWFFQKIWSAYVACLRYLSICISSVSHNLRTKHRQIRLSSKSWRATAICVIPNSFSLRCEHLQTKPPQACANENHFQPPIGSSNITVCLPGSDQATLA